MTLDVSVGLNLREAGEVRKVSSRLDLPTVGTGPGVYRVELLSKVPAAKRRLYMGGEANGFALECQPHSRIYDVSRA